MIILCGLDGPQKRLTPAMVDNAFSHNSEGAGIAWREEGKVHWEKGLDLEAMQALCAEKPLPYVAHFRISTCGGKRQDLCHPFPIQKDVPLFTAGNTGGYVLFHNGHWTDWRREMYATKWPVPKGKWSDSRAMAFMAAHRSLGILDLIDEKCIAFGPDDYEVFGTGWVKVDEIWCSNGNWNYPTHQQVNSSFQMCRERSCTQMRFAQTNWCIEHLCKESLCNNQRLGFTEFCFEHKDKIGTNPPKRGYAQPVQGVTCDDEVDAWDQGMFMGHGMRQHGTHTAATTEGPFREGPKTVEGGSVVKQEAEGSPPERAAVASGDAKEKEEAAALEAALAPGVSGAVVAISTINEILDLKRWACSINTKKRPGKQEQPGVVVDTETETDRLKRIADRRKGIERLGPM